MIRQGKTHALMMAAEKAKAEGRTVIFKTRPRDETETHAPLRDWVRELYESQTMTDFKPFPVLQRRRDV